MKICFSLADQSFLRTKSIGILNVSLGLLKGLASAPAVEKLVLLSNSSIVLPQTASSRMQIENFDRAAHGRFGRLLWDQWGVYQAAQRSECDWIFLPKGYASFVAKPPLPLAAYAHDAMQDFYQTHYPAAVSGWEKHYFTRSMAATLRHSSVIFTNSEFSRNEILRLAAKLKVTPCPIINSGIGFDAKPELMVRKDSNYVVVLVSKWPHKLTGLALTFVRDWQQKSGFTGDIHLVGQLPTQSTVPVDWKHFSRLPEKEYLPMLQQARALVYFSEYEGFGMPPIEAILQGTPAVFSRIPAMQESCGDCGFSFSNGSTDEFSKAMEDALNCPTEKTEQWSQILRSRHTWKNVTQKITEGLMQANKGIK